MSQTFSYLKRFQSYFGLALIFAVSIILSPHDSHGGNIFLGSENLTDIIRMMSVVGVMALGMTFVITSAGIDLSVGSVLALSTCICALLVSRWDANSAFHNQAFLSNTVGRMPQSTWPYFQIGIAILVALLACTAVGFLTGAITAKLAIPPFIATLATMIGIRGFTKWLSNNSTIDIGFGKTTDGMFADFASQKAVMIIVFAVLAVVFAFFFAKTVFGRHVRAVGDNERAARYSGLPIARVKIWVYTLSGLLCGVAGILYTAQGHQGDPNGGSGLELDVITAVVLGGTSLAGGKGTVVGTIIGTLIIGILTNILGLMKVDMNVQMMVKAVIIILAVWLQKRERAD